MDGESDLAIEASGLVKTFGTTRAVDEIDLAVLPGSVYGLLGPNGAGKTTAIRMLATLLRPDSGTARVFGHDVVGEAEAVRARVSLTGQFAAVDEDLTGAEYLVLMARLRGYPRRQAKVRAHELLDGFVLSDAAHRQVKAYSGGMRRRIDVAASLVATPDLLFLDEPTTGLDPRSRNQVWEIVRGIVADGTTVLLTTQYLDEADQLADRIGVIDHGRVVATGSANQLKAKVGGQTLVVRPQDRADLDLVESLVAELTQRVPVLDAERGELAADVTDPAALAAVVQRLDAFEVPLTEISLRPPSLDEVFLALTGQPGTESPTTDESVTTEDAA